MITFLLGMLAGGLAASGLAFLDDIIRRWRRRRRELTRLRPPMSWNR